MTSFIIRFCICNIFVGVIIGMLVLLKHIFRHTLTSHMQYYLWLVLLGLLAVPFIPVQSADCLQILSCFKSMTGAAEAQSKSLLPEASAFSLSDSAGWMQDFAISVTSKTPSAISILLLSIWLIGMLVMIVRTVKAWLQVDRLRKAALPLQNHKVRKLYRHCLAKLHINRAIPIYSTAFLQSPIIVGAFKPCIYLPIHLISDYHEADMRYMLLHELQHYKHKDTFTNYLINLAAILYWFNPLVWYACKEMRCDMELACDSAVLQMLPEDAYEAYGNTLINLAEKLSFTPFPFAAGIGGGMKQLKRRVVNIASYERTSFRKKLKGITAFILTVVLLIGLTPMLSTYAADGSHYQWEASSKKLSYADLSAYFDGYDGSFVLYDLENDAWCIYDIENSTLRLSPDSTYKIYDALFGLEEGIISPDNSLISWNGEAYPFAAWNTSHTLSSAMTASVNWYFQEIDEQLGASTVQSYLQMIDYGNETIDESLSTYWLESSLKISPIEQVELLTKLYHNSFGFAPENVKAVKASICLSSSAFGALYGKTGTGRINGKDVNGWFVGYVEGADNTYFFAANIAADADATGSNAARIALSILSDMNIWK